jgi:hypothetical protein
MFHSSSNTVAIIKRTEANTNQTIVFQVSLHFLLFIMLCSNIQENSDDRPWEYMSDIAVLRCMQLLIVIQLLQSLRW